MTTIDSGQSANFLNIWLKLSRNMNGNRLSELGKLCFIRYASIWGFAPFQYNRTKRRIELIPSRRHIFRWKLTIVLGTLFRGFVLGNCVYDYYYESLDLADVESMMRLWLLTSFAFSGFLHLHTLWRFQEFPGIMNAAIHLFEGLHGNI